VLDLLYLQWCPIPTDGVAVESPAAVNELQWSWCGWLDRSNQYFSIGPSGLFGLKRQRVFCGEKIRPMAIPNASVLQFSSGASIISDS